MQTRSKSSRLNHGYKPKIRKTSELNKQERKTYQQIRIQNKYKKLIRTTT